MDSSLYQQSSERHILAERLNLVKNEYILLYRAYVKLTIEELIFSVQVLQQRDTEDQAALYLRTNDRYAEFRERANVLCGQLRECGQWQDTLTEALEALEP